ncbi:MAG: helix-turn-helix domain-containing protein [Anaerolineae bacterium]|nr:helix-turn-helix domain-containing protein [Anaerolineae bacterium]
MTKELKIDRRFEIADLETLKVLSDPLRLQVLENIGLANERGELATVKRLAGQMELPATKLYYHVNLLEKHDLIRVADTRMVSGITEKHYQIRAYNITASKELFATGSGDRDHTLDATKAAVAAALTSTETDLFKLIESGTFDGVNSPTKPKQKILFSRGNAHLTQIQSVEFLNRLEALINEFNETNHEQEDTEVYGLTIALYPKVTNHNSKETEATEEPKK